MSRNPSDLPAWYNRGARFDLRDGRHVPSGGVFRAASDDPDVIRRGGKLRPAPMGMEVTVPDPPATTEGRFMGVEFGSEAAHDLARSEGMEADDFVGEGSGQEGAFLVGDVREILTQRGSG